MNASLASKDDGLPLSFYVLSAERASNTPIKNARARMNLDDALTDANIPFRRAIGHTAKWGDEQSRIVWVRPGRAKDTRVLLDGLLLRFQQEAMVFVTSRRVAYLWSGSPLRRTKLGRWSGVSGSTESWDGNVPIGDYTYTPSDGAYYTIIPTERSNTR